MKVCVVCNKEKDDSQFYMRDKKCKECRLAFLKSYREKNHEKCCELRRKKYAENVDYHRMKDKERMQRMKVEYPERYAKVISRKNTWRKKNAQKMRAWQLLNDALRYGKMQKPTVCSKCGCKGDIEGHHEDYSKPYDVIWLCSDCHHALHAEKRRKQRVVDYEGD